ncbi:hypothetical protein FA10DRAFT_285799 [Acaromyces ingoldii]|uniref:Uncharacterized protein n=1 Tax=Acaromyces ingoldii TaxID=215250 RepID=A0A316YLZ0_9BASI|nr:hypothetical protein FA10DRAFT_285799 [Acaromyces ingoldii]PWN90086.1 hypothetical protein FA10DRAFT_285799 [Acaromyces ingoldii]
MASASTEGKGKILLKDSSLYRPDLIGPYVDDLFASPLFPRVELDKLLDSPPRSEAAVTRLTKEETDHVITTLAALSAMASSYKENSGPDKENEELEARLRLGLCRLLTSGHEVEARMDLDMVRDQLYRRKIAREKVSLRAGSTEAWGEGRTEQGSGRSEKEMHMTIKALKGLEIACIRMGKDQEAGRYRRWREQQRTDAPHTV